MSADPFADRLSEYIDGTLSPDERDSTEAHLDGCRACRALVRELRSVRRDAATLDRLEPDERVWSAISNAVRARRQAAARRSGLQSGLAVAAALLLGVSIWFALSPRETTPSDPQELADMVRARAPGVRG